MNGGAFGENFPYSNFHDLNMDWIIKIAKDFLDQYTHIQQIIEDGEVSIQNLTNQSLEDLQTKADQLETLLQQWYDTHSEDIANELATAISNFNIQAQEKAAETLESIPADYTSLATDVQNLTRKNLKSVLTIGELSAETGIVYPVANFKRASSTPFRMYPGDKIQLMEGYFYLARYDLDMKYIETISDNVNYTNGNIYESSTDEMVAVSVRKVDNTGIADMSEVGNVYLIAKSLAQVDYDLNQRLYANQTLIYNNLGLTLGELDPDTGNVASYSPSKRAISGILYLRAGTSISISSGRFYAVAYNIYLGNPSLLTTDTKTFTMNRSCYVRLAVQNEDASLMTDTSSIGQIRLIYNSFADNINKIYDIARTYYEMLNPLAGKSMALIGDSISAGAGYAGGYGAIIALENGMRQTNISQNGATIASGTRYQGTDRYWICKHITDLPANYNYYIIDGGFNDAGNNVPPFPTGVSDVTPELITYKHEDDSNTYYAMENICYDLINNFSGAKIGFIFPHKISNNEWTVQPGNQYNYTWGDYKALMKKVLKKYGIPYIDIGEVTPMDTFYDGVKQTYTMNGDAVHPNKLGYETFYVNAITNWMRSL